MDIRDCMDYLTSQMSVGSIEKAGAGRAGSGEKIGGRGTSRPSLFLYQIPLVARRPAAFDKPHRPLSRGGHFESQANKKLCFLHV